MSDPVPLGRVLAALRVGRGWSQSELARRSGLASAQVSRYERGAVRPTFDSLERLLDGLGVDRLQLARVSRVLEEAESGTEPRAGSMDPPPARPPLPGGFTDLFLGRGGDGGRAGPGPAAQESETEAKVLLAVRALAAVTAMDRPAPDDPEGERLARRAGDLVEQLVRHHFRSLDRRRS
ncbi:MAG: helix-turn-helix domain-containing protein [Thermoanaerobaculia bacterium]